MNWRHAIFTLALFTFTASTGRGSVRVALMDLSCEDNSYRSTQAAENFTIGLQAAVAADSSFDWVERVELSKAEAELRLGNFGLIDRAEAIRSGRWLKADWAVLGTISTNASAGRTLRFEVVDLHRADVLVAAELVFAPQADSYFRVAPADLAKAATAVRSALDTATRVYNQSQHQPSVAVLFLARGTDLGYAEPGVAKPFDSLAEELRMGLSRAATNSGRFHLVQFQRPDAAMDEANLVLSGMVESDTNAWEKIADQYIWGSCNLGWRKSYDRSTRTWLNESRVEVHLNFWDTKREPTVVNLALTNAASVEAVVARVTEVITPLFGQTSSAPVTAQTRDRVSESLVTHALAMAKGGGGEAYDTPDNRRQWFELVHELETACFFDAGNQKARELWARVRWGQLAQAIAGNEFFFARRRSEAWRKHVEQFGFQSVLPPGHIGEWKNGMSVASHYLLSAWRPFEMFDFSQDTLAGWGVPRDTGGPELRAWQQQFAQEFFTRFADAPDDPIIPPHSWDFFCGALKLHGQSFVVADPKLRMKVLERLWPYVLEGQRGHAGPVDPADWRDLRLHFQQMGRPGGERAWLEQLDQLATSERRKKNETPVQLPRASELDPKP